jgi:hypothetical protein
MSGNRAAIVALIAALAFAGPASGAQASCRGADIPGVASRGGIPGGGRAEAPTPCLEAADRPVPPTMT